MTAIKDAQTRIETALSRLEQALDRKPAVSADTGDLARELAAVKADYADLKTRSDTVAERLDGTVARLRRLLGETAV